MQRSSRMTSTGIWADPAKTGQLEDLGSAAGPGRDVRDARMCAMLIVGLVYWAVARRAHRTWHTALTDERREMRAEYSQRLYRVLEAF
jgi:hypothetical protein